ncbi:unnamed protein product [Arabidopsis halleri]
MLQCVFVHCKVRSGHDLSLSFQTTLFSFYFLCKFS